MLQHTLKLDSSFKIGVIELSFAWGEEMTIHCDGDYYCWFACVVPYIARETGGIYYLAFSTDGTDNKIDHRSLIEVTPGLCMGFGILLREIALFFIYFFFLIIYCGKSHFF